MAKNPTISAYNQFHQVYDDETAEFWELFPESIVNKFVKDLPGKKILNIGSGPGRDALILRRKGLDVICVDASEEMIERTRQLGFDSLLEDMRNLKFPDNSFDGAWVYTSLIHIPKNEAKGVLRKLKRMLKEGGTLLVGAIDGDFEGMVERKSMPGVKRFFKHYQEQELRDLIEDTGFKFIYQERYQPHSTIYLNQIFKRTAWLPLSQKPE